MTYKWIAAAVTTVLATGVLTADVSGATTHPQNDEPRATSSAPVQESDTSAAEPARVSIGPLGRILTSVDALIDAAAPASGSRNLDTLQDRFAAVDTAARELRTAYRAAPAGPAVPFARVTVRQSPPPSIAADEPRILPAEEDEPRILPAKEDEPKTLPTTEEQPKVLPATGTSTQTKPQDLRSALSRLLEHADALVQKANDPEADEAAVRKAARPISQDALAVVSTTLDGIKRS